MVKVIIDECSLVSFKYPHCCNYLIGNWGIPWVVGIVIESRVKDSERVRFRIIVYKL